MSLKVLARMGGEASIPWGNIHGSSTSHEPRLTPWILSGMAAPARSIKVEQTSPNATTGRMIERVKREGDDKAKITMKLRTILYHASGFNSIPTKLPGSTVRQHS